MDGRAIVRSERTVDQFLATLAAGHCPDAHAAFITCVNSHFYFSVSKVPGERLVERFKLKPPYLTGIPCPRDRPIFQCSPGGVYTLVCPGEFLANVAEMMTPRPRRT